MTEQTPIIGQHIVKSFDDELNWLDNTIAEMGGLAEAQLAAAIDALVRRDAEKAAEETQCGRKLHAAHVWDRGRSGHRQRRKVHDPD